MVYAFGTTGGVQAMIQTATTSALCDVQTAQTRDKIKELEPLAAILSSHRSGGQKVMHCHGVFDLLHIGHIRHFEEAKRSGDILVVTLTSDRYVNKGPHRPAFSQELRAEAIAALSCVDYVAINDSPMAIDLIKLLRPNFYVKGSDYKNAADDVTGGITLEREAVESVGGAILFTDDIVFSSSGLINRYVPLLSKELTDYLASFSRKYSPDEVVSYIDRMKPLKVLTIGETIIDEYHYCKAIGKASKDPMLAVKSLHTEKFAGGTAAVANNLANFSDTVGIVTLVGDDGGEQFIQGKLKDSIRIRPLVRGSSPTVTKTRFIESSSFTKLLELYSINDLALDEADNALLCRTLEELVPKYDAVLVMDFGHGMLTPEATRIVCDKANFLAINTQSNAGNLGYQNIYKYSRADYVCITETEARIEVRDRTANLQQIVPKLASDLSCRTVTITRGKDGCICYRQDEGFYDVPSLAGEVVDRMGAGDAFLSVTSMAAALNMPVEMLGLIGNAVAAQAVATVGHRESINRATLTKFITSLLK
jgi:rfaE bifunctional protein kinase chain/domain/rfaE bifunctional protein nucleotidyltransferase chain/domain